jgi:hypothetical protein
METQNQQKSAKIFLCEICDYKTSRKSSYDKHLRSRAHLLETNGNGASYDKDVLKYHCKLCDYYTSRKSNFTQHLSSRKHSLEIKSANLVAKSCKKIQPQFFNCEYCNKVYTTRSGLWKHETKCKLALDNKKNDKKNDEKEQSLKEIIEMNKNLTEQLIKLSDEKKIVNNQINLNIFLNEECKDAINIMDFADSIRLQLQDLEKVGKIGYVEGMTDLIVSGLNRLDLHKRPIHCTDKEQSVLYIKDNDGWEKENKEKDKMKKAIELIRKSGLKQVPSWIQKEMDENEKCDEYKYYNILQNTIGGSNDEEIVKNDEKIIKNVVKEVVIDNNYNDKN